MEEVDLEKLEESKKRVLTFKTVNQGMVILECVNFSENFIEFQNFVVIELKMRLMMVVSKNEAGELLTKVIKEELNPRNNPFLIKQKQLPIENSLLNALQNIPKLGSVKAKTLMETYQSLENLLQASEEDLTQTIGNCFCLIRKGLFLGFNSSFITLVNSSPASFLDTTIINLIFNSITTKF